MTTDDLLGEVTPGALQEPTLEAIALDELQLWRVTGTNGPETVTTYLATPARVKFPAITGAVLQAFSHIERIERVGWVLVLTGPPVGQRRDPRSSCRGTSS